MAITVLTAMVLAIAVRAKNEGICFKHPRQGKFLTKVLPGLRSKSLQPHLPTCACITLHITCVELKKGGKKNSKMDPPLQF